MEKDVRLLFQIMYIYSKDTNCIKRYWILPNICLVDSKIRTDGWSLRQREERAGSWKLLSDDRVRKHSTCNVELKSYRVLSIDNIPSILRMIIWKTIEFHETKNIKEYLCEHLEQFPWSQQFSPMCGCILWTLQNCQH